MPTESIRCRPVPLLVVVASLLATACASAGSAPVPARPPGRESPAPPAAWRTVTAIGPPQAGLELETVRAGTRRHTTLRSAAGSILEYRIEEPDWYLRAGVDDVGLPTDRWVHIDLDALRAAGVEAPAWITERSDDAGFVFDLAVGDRHAGDVVVEVSGDDREVDVVFASGLRTHGSRTRLPAGTVVELPSPDEVVPLAELAGEAAAG